MSFGILGTVTGAPLAPPAALKQGARSRGFAMSVIKKGSIGPEVRGLQLRLDTKLKPSPKLNADGHFGPKTEAAVIRFQRENNLAADGIVGPKMWAALLAPPKPAAPPNLTKFVQELGTIDDFVSHVAGLEASHRTTTELMQALLNFFGTANKKRYLLVKGDPVGVVDFRHFFAATVVSYSGVPAKPGGRLGGSPGETVLLGVANEVQQCVGEAVAQKFNSCFAAEDLGSNRLGAQFGEHVKVREAEASKQKVSQLLREYLLRVQPAAPDQVHAVKTASRWDIALETLAAIVAGIGDFLIPRAY
jgi:hypothetical protein